MTVEGSDATVGNDAKVIGLVALAHGLSHFGHLMLAPLFPFLKDAFAVSYAELGLLMSVFFVVSGVGQALAGFVVDRFGARPVLFGGVALIGVAAFGMSASPNYWTMSFFAGVAGLGNCVFHPADYTLLNRKVSLFRLGHAYSVHGISGNLGWAIAPAFLVSLVAAFSWRVALAGAGVLAFSVLALLWVNRDRLALDAPAHRHAATADTGLGFLKIPAVWMCFAFFFVSAVALSGVQSFAPEAARVLHGVPLGLAAACLSVYMVCSACGMVAGGFLVTDPARCERVIGAGYGFAATMALTLGLADVPALMVPVLFGAMGFGAGLSGPSRDLLVKRAAPENATGRVYGVVYSGLDVGMAIAPAVFGAMMDAGRPSMVWLGMAAFQAMLIVSAFNIGRARRTALVAA
jgi:FSR family fosmidomycin resistance protein-like MFS transporter